MDTEWISHFIFELAKSLAKFFEILRIYKLTGWTVSTSGRSGVKRISKQEPG